MCSRNHMDLKHPLASALLAPLYRLQELEPTGKLWAPLAAFGAFLVNDLWVLLTVILVLAHAIDWLFGRRAARAQARFDPQVSEWGLQSKVASILEVMLLRMLELALVGRLPETTPEWFLTAAEAGYFAVAVTAALIYQDLRSIEEHRQALGGAPIPILSVVLDVMQRATDALLPTPSNPANPSNPQEESDAPGP